jgi:hypothetical protein
MADGRARKVTGHLGFSLVCSRPFGKTGDRSIVSYLIRPMPFMSPSGNAWRRWIGPGLGVENRCVVPFSTASPRLFASIHIIARLCKY